MRIFKTRLFNRWAKDEKISDAVLNRAIEDLQQGAVEANLGGHVYKKRIAIHGRGNAVECVQSLHLKLKIMLILCMALLKISKLILAKMS